MASGIKTVPGRLGLPGGQGDETMAKRTIRKNIYGNYVGYVGRSREMEFGEDETGAKEWLETGKTLGSINVEGTDGLKFRFG